MHMYCRYVDDSNQIVETEDGSETDTVERLKVIVNRILDGIVMEEDLPEKHSDEKLPILDMACWIDKQGMTRYMHYEKAVSNKDLIPARSAHSNSCKRSVAISEIRGVPKKSGLLCLNS